MNNNIHKDLDQYNKKKTVFHEQNTKTFTVFHQNICGLFNIKEELLNSLTRNSPQIICVTEYHLTDEELESITTLHPYNLGAKFGRQMHKCGGLCIFVQDNMHCTNIIMDRYSNKNDIEISAVKLHILSLSIIKTVYRSPTVNIAYVLNNLEAALNQAYNNTVDIILCVSFNILLMITRICKL
jgi:hypothetical protein